MTRGYEKNRIRRIYVAYTGLIHIKKFVMIQVVTSVNMMSWVVTSCGLAGRYKLLGETCRLHLQP
jgi:hypothetical protein